MIYIRPMLVLVCTLIAHQKSAGGVPPDDARLIRPHRRGRDALKIDQRIS